MVKIKHILVILLVVIIGIWAAFTLFQSEEKKIKKEFNSLSEWVSKESEEDAIAMFNRMRNIRALFHDSCGLKIPGQSISGSYTREEIGSYAAQGRSQFSHLNLKFYDLDIAFTEKEVAKVHLTARLIGRLTTGENVDETHEIDCLLKKLEKKWLFTTIEVVEVLKK
jgi:hypothetical protein